MMASGLAESRKWQQCLHRSESSGTMITSPREQTAIPHTLSHFDVAFGKWGSVTVTAKKRKRTTSFSLHS